LSEQIEWTCKNCDADNSVCDCKPVRRLSEDEKYHFISDHVRILSTGDALDLINRVIDLCGMPKKGEL